MNAPLYTTEILRLAASLPEPERFDAHGTAELRSPTCGSSVQTAVLVDAHGKVERLSLTVKACAFGQASSALVAAHARGRSRDEIASALSHLSAWLAGERDSVPEWPGITALSPARSRASRHGAILLPFRSLLAALEAAAG